MWGAEPAHQPHILDVLDAYKEWHHIIRPHSPWACREKTSEKVENRKQKTETMVKRRGEPVRLFVSSSLSLLVALKTTPSGNSRIAICVFRTEHKLNNGSTRWGTLLFDQLKRRELAMADWCDNKSEWESEKKEERREREREEERFTSSLTCDFYWKWRRVNWAAHNHIIHIDPSHHKNLDYR